MEAWRRQPLQTRQPRASSRTRHLTWLEDRSGKNVVKGLKLASRGRKNAKKRAVVAVARKLAVLLHRLWVDGEVYQPLYQAERAVAVGAVAGALS